MSNKHGATGTLLFVSVVLLAVLPALYVLSTGPATWLVMSGYASPETMSTIYFPLGWVCERCDPLASAVSWYDDLFCPAQQPTIATPGPNTYGPPNGNPPGTVPTSSPNLSLP
jgi:hypothetical protein